MRELSPLEKRVFNEGERLIPGITHNVDELIRHRNSYVFWKKIIEYDIAQGLVQSEKITIIDFGCGVGHGCLTLAEIPDVHVVGVDNSAEVVEYAKQNYSKPNIDYEVADLQEYTETMPEVDYVVSRGVLEHIPDGLKIANTSKWQRRLLFDVPYRETTGNPHHVLHNIDETHFENFKNVELFYQDLQGYIYDATTKSDDPAPNMIMCASRADTLSSVSKLFSTFPLRPWYPAEDHEVCNTPAEVPNKHNLPFHRKVVGKLKYWWRKLGNGEN